MAKEGFISWSGPESQKIAENLRDFMLYVLANPTLFVASKDLKGGEIWFTQISARLEACDVGVIVVTPQNKSKPWLHFEAGAIAKKVGQSAAIPLLCGTPIGDLSGTALAQMQALEMNRTGLRELCARLNDLLELGLAESHIDTAFDMWWTKYESLLTDPSLWEGDVKPRKTPTTSDLSVQLTQISTTLSSLADRLDRIDTKDNRLSPEERWVLADYWRSRRPFRTIDEATMKSLDDETLRAIASQRLKKIDMDNRVKRRGGQPSDEPK